MSLRSIYLLHRSARWIKKGARELAAQKLAGAVKAGDSDPRLAIRYSLASGDYQALTQAAKSGGAGRGAFIFLALGALAQGDHEKGMEWAKKALDEAKGNITAKALLALAVFGKSGNPAELIRLADLLPHTSLRAQGLIMLAAENAIRASDSANRGAPEKEDESDGPLSFIFNLLDDFAVWIYWLISLTLNLVINMRDSNARALYWRVIEGDRLEGLRRFGPAMERFAEALTLKPDCVEALESMVKHRIMRGEYQEAEAALDQLLLAAGEGASGDPSIQKWKADIAFFQGRLEAARGVYESLESQFPLSYIIPYRLGLCALAEGERSAAAAEFEKALGRINPALLAERVKLLSGLKPNAQQGGPG